MKKATLQNVIEAHENYIFSDNLGKGDNYQNTELKDLTVKNLNDIAIHLLKSEYSNGVLPDNINLVSFAWNVLLKRAISKGLSVFY